MNKQKQSRKIICCNCDSWELAPNVEMGTCRTLGSPTWYNSQCLLGVSEEIKKPEIETKIKID